MWERGNNDGIQIKFDKKEKWEQHNIMGKVEI
jgi:hypothetical protein